jgi:predicted transcriptional regulator
MATVKVTFTLDAATVARLRQAAERLGKPKSAVVREAIQEYSERTGRLSEAKRQRMLRAFDRFVPAIPSRPQAEDERELRELREARRSGGRRSAHRARQ